MVEADKVAPAFSGEVPRSAQEQGPRKFAPAFSHEVPGSCVGGGSKEVRTSCPPGAAFMSWAREWEGSGRDIGGSGVGR